MRLSVRRPSDGTAPLRAAPEAARASVHWPIGAERVRRAPSASTPAEPVRWDESPPARARSLGAGPSVTEKDGPAGV